MKKPELPDNETKRLQALQQYEILDTEPEEAFDELTKLASEVCGTPIALVSLVDDHRQWFKSHHGLDATETPKEVAFCAHAILKPEELFIIPDATKDERFHDNPLVTGNPNVVFYAGTSLISSDGYPLGTFCIIDNNPRNLNENQKEILRLLGRQAQRLIENHITNKKLVQSQKKLFKNQLLFSETIDNIFDALIMINNRGIIALVNNQAVNLFGYSEEELVGQNIKMLMPSPFQENHDDYIKSFLDTGEAKVMGIGRQVLGKRKDNVSFPMDLAITQMKLENEHYFIGIIRDISERKKLEDRLILGKKILDKAQQISKTGSWEWDVINNKIYWTDEVYRIFGQGPQKFDATYEAYINAIHPDDREHVQEVVNNAFQFGNYFKVHHRIKTESGIVKYAYGEGEVTRDSEGNPISMLGIVQDITKAKEAEAKIDEINRIIKEYMDILNKYVISYRANLFGQVLDVSDALSHISGFTKPEILNKNHSIFMHPEVKDQVLEKIADMIEKEKTFFGEIKHSTIEGGVFYSEAIISPQYDKDKKMNGFIAILKDITDKKIIHDMAITDELTKLYNRRHFNESFPGVFNSARQKQCSFAFIMSDVDYFKRYNDTYGHDKGDEVLQKVGNLFWIHFKNYTKHIFRLGGEEFGVLLLFQDFNEFQNILKNFRRKVIELGIEHKGNEAAKVVTISAGIYVVPLQKNDKLQIKDVYRKADEALYKAKEKGRNRMVVFT